MKEYTYEVTIKWGQVCEGETEEQAREQLKNSFAEEFNFFPSDEEIKLIE